MCERKVIYAVSRCRNILIRQKQGQLDENLSDTIKLPICHIARRVVLNDPSLALMKKKSHWGRLGPQAIFKAQYFSKMK